MGPNIINSLSANAAVLQKLISELKGLRYDIEQLENIGPQNYISLAPGSCSSYRVRFESEDHAEIVKIVINKLRTRELGFVTQIRQVVRNLKQDILNQSND